MANQNITFNISINANISTDFIELCYSGPPLEKVPSKLAQLCLTYLYLFTSLLSLCGNLIVIIVQIYGVKSSENIRKYLVNLALSDLIIGVVCVPFNYSSLIIGHWNYPHWLCPTVQYVQPLCVFVTAITLSLIGIERYVFTLHPHSSLYKLLQSHNRKILLSTWILGFVYSFTIFGHTETREYLQEDHTHYECVYSSKLNTQQRRLLIAVNFILSFLCPFLMLTYSYSAIMKTLVNSRQQQETHELSVNSDLPADKKRNSDSIHNRLNAIRMLLTVTVLYSVCWMPIKIYQFLLEFGILAFCTADQFYALINVYILCHWLAMANSFVNPIVYASMNASFRNDFWKILNFVYLCVLSLGRRTSTANN